MTPNHSRPTKCETCVNGTIIKGYGESQRVTRCSVLRGPIPFPVYECSEHELRMEVSLNAMWNMAYLIKADKSGKIGFMQPKRLQEGYDDRYDVDPNV